MASIDTTPSLVATNALQSIPFGSIIGAPLSACVEAQAKAAQTSWQFIKEVGLTDTKDGKGKEAIYVNFEFRKNGRSTKPSAPLLTIVPIPYLAIKDIDISFKASISASASTSKTTKSSFEVGASMKASVSGGLPGIVHASMEMSASISSKKDSAATRDSKYSVEYTMDVNVKAGQDDMPAGMAKVLEILNQSIDTIDSKGEMGVSEQNVTLVEGQGTTYITYKNPEGFYDSSQIKVYTFENGKEGSEATNDCNISADEVGALCTFSKAGHYIAKAENSKAIIFVK